jgi:hypothetical protein
MRLQVETGLGLQNPDRGKAHGHERRLGVGGERQILRRAFPHDRGQLLGEGLVHFVEHGLGLGEVLGKGLAHAHGLASLAGEYECALHRERNLYCIESARNWHP